MLQVTEIYHSIQGEGSRAGLPCIFVRLSGCSLRCTWCDTEYGYNAGRQISIQQILDEISTYDCSLVEVTGGEPLMQSETPQLIEELLNNEYTVLVETSGSYDISCISKEAVRIVDIKCPGSGMVDKNDYENLARMTDKDELKFVIADKVDFEWACDIINKYQLQDNGNNFISPVYGEVNLQELADWILQSGLSLRLQVQLHKTIWGPDKTGV